jgi:hypothetical protein
MAKIGQLILRGISRLAYTGCAVGIVGFVIGLIKQELPLIVIGAVFAVFGGGVALIVHRWIVVPAVKPS